MHHNKLLLDFFRYFWRNYSGSEVDLIEEIDGKYYAYEFKLKIKKYKLSKEFLNTYQPVKTNIVHRENFLEFLL